MERPYSITLLISSPNDVLAQRDLIEKCCFDWNRDKGRTLNRIVQSLRWEKDMPITSNETYQSIIDEELVKNSDLLIALFWTRFGTPTGMFESGTLAEIEQFLDTNRPAIVYFYAKKIEPGKINPEQLTKINLFKEKYADKGIYREIRNDKELVEFFMKDLTYNFEKVIKQNQTQLPISASGELKENNKFNNSIENEYWYEVSISDLINDYLLNENISQVTYKKGLTFTENCYLWKNVTSVKHSTLIDFAKKAREHAFNIKYGNYDYSKDLRSNYSNWHRPILDILNKKLINGIHNLKIVGVGSNNGSELLEIFPDFSANNLKLEVCDISALAIEEGKTIHKGKIKFNTGNMEDSPLTNDFDIYLNLRAIHSSGNDIKSTIADCFGVVKEGGIAIFSVSNGYLTPKKPGSKELFEVNGMWESNKGKFSSDKPFYLASKIRRKLEEYGFKNCGINTGDTEIFIYGIK
ncbi:MAG: methyltransferase domain-containing protein [Bacteroidetes bacterium]|nr:methyltransferase domain-containing protein [Bacteroidota bacterium]